MFLWNILLALVWAALNGAFSPRHLIVGFGMGYVLLWMVQPVVGRSAYFLKVRQVLKLSGFFLWELVLANCRVAYDIVTPRNHMRPGVLAVSLDARTDVEITLLANLITLTPGTLSLDVSADRRTLYIHVMYIEEEGLDATRLKIKNGFERRILEVLR